MNPTDPIEVRCVQQLDWDDGPVTAVARLAPEGQSVFAILLGFCPPSGPRIYGLFAITEEDEQRLRKLYEDAQAGQGQRGWLELGSRSRRLLANHRGDLLLVRGNPLLEGLHFHWGRVPLKPHRKHVGITVEQAVEEERLRYWSDVFAGAALARREKALAKALMRAPNADALRERDVADALSQFFEELRSADDRSDVGARVGRDDGIVVLIATRGEPSTFDLRGYVLWLHHPLDPLWAKLHVDTTGERMERYSIKCGLSARGYLDAGDIEKAWHDTSLIDDSVEWFFDYSNAG